MYSTLVKEHAEIDVWLRKLGGMTTEEIVELFRKEGIKGIPAFGHICPLAAYLDRATGLKVAVGRSTVIVQSGPLSGQHISLPKSCQEFVRRFDAGWWPDLFGRPETMSIARLIPQQPKPESLMALIYAVSAPVAAPTRSCPPATEAPSEDRELMGSVA